MVEEEDIDEVLEEDFDAGSDEELENLIEDDVRGGLDFRSSESSRIVVPSLERGRIVESLEAGVRNVEVDNDEPVESPYGVRQDYVEEDNYKFGEGDNLYDSNPEILDTSSRDVSLPMGTLPQENRARITQGGSGYPGVGDSGDKKYHSKLEQSSRDDEKRKRQKRMY